jgi:hypothetical protein
MFLFAGFATSQEREQMLDELGLIELAIDENAAPVYREIAGTFIYPGIAPRKFDDIRRRFIRSIHQRYGISDGSIGFRRPEFVSESERLLLARFLKENLPVFRKLESATEMGGCQFGDYSLLPERIEEFSSSYTDGPSISRELARMLSVKSLWALDNGKLQNAIRWNAVGYRLTNQMDGDQTLISGLVQGALAPMFARDLQMLITASGDEALEWGPVLAELKNAVDVKNSIPFLKGEFAFITLYGDHEGKSETETTESGESGRNRTQTIEILTTLIRSLEDDAIWAYEVRKPLTSKIPENLDESEWHPNALAKGLDVMDQGRVAGQQAMMGIGLRKYKTDEGEYPKTLDALVPDYLKSLPIDPFSNRPHVYRLSEVGYVLYSFGVDGEDDQGRHDPREGDLVWSMK